VSAPIFPGPCQRCGATNFQLSNTGIGVCPQCSVAAASEQKRAELEAWKRWLMAPGIERPSTPFNDRRKHFGLLDDRPSG
jgi:uncharacterized Zn finger protein (UPF0148 family)